jgi:SAM-dependent methyltransferase
MLNDFSSPCACCALPTAMALAVGLWMALRAVVSMVPSSWKRARSSLRATSKLMAAIVGLLAVFLGVLASAPALRSRFFAWLCTVMTASSSPEMIASKCDAVASASGKVMELGPGATGSLKCWEGEAAASILEWVGVEPNMHFAPAITAERERLALPFGTRLVWRRAEEDPDINVPTASFDTVVSSHVLCSVDDVDAVLRMAARVLKPGGRLLFFEHTATANPDDRPLLTLAQAVTAPLLHVLGNGCTYRRLWQDLAKLNATGEPFAHGVSFELFDAPIPLPPLWPHMRGVATRARN